MNRKSARGRQRGILAERMPGNTTSGHAKIETCLSAVVQGVEAAVILDGRVPHALLLEIFTAGGAGTLVNRQGSGAK